MGVGDVDGDKILATRNHPVHQLAGLLRGQKGVYEDGIALAVNERHRIRYPGKVLFARRDSLSGAAALLGQELPFELGRRHISSFSDPARPAFAGASTLTFAFESHDGAALMLDIWHIQ